MKGATGEAGTACPSGTLEFTSCFYWGSLLSIFSLMYNVCRTLFVLVLLTIVLYVFVNLQILITPLVPSRVSYDVMV